MRGFVCERISGKLVTWQYKPATAIIRGGWGKLEILYVMDRPSPQFCKECKFRDSVDVDVRVHGYGFGNDRV